MLSCQKCEKNSFNSISNWGDCQESKTKCSTCTITPELQIQCLDPNQRVDQDGAQLLTRAANRVLEVLQRPQNSRFKFLLEPFKATYQELLVRKALFLCPHLPGPGILFGLFEHSCRMLKLNRNVNFEEFCATLLHEMIHAFYGSEQDSYTICRYLFPHGQHYPNLPYAWDDFQNGHHLFTRRDANGDVFLIHNPADHFYLGHYPDPRAKRSHNSSHNWLWIVFLVLVIVLVVLVIVLVVKFRSNNNDIFTIPTSVAPSSGTQ